MDEPFDNSFFNFERPTQRHISIKYIFSIILQGQIDRKFTVDRSLCVCMCVCVFFVLETRMTATQLSQSGLVANSFNSCKKKARPHHRQLQQRSRLSRWFPGNHEVNPYIKTCTDDEKTANAYTAKDLERLSLCVHLHARILILSSPDRSRYVPCRIEKASTFV